DFSQQPPTQELIARDLHNIEWKFKHIFRGQPKRHLLTTGWSVFVSAKRLVAGDSVVFIWNEKNQLLLGIRRANRPETVIPTSVLSSDSMHLGLLAAAAHAASTYTRFTVFYNPRASPSEFIIPLAKYLKAVYHTRVSVGMRFRMLFETDESSVRRYMGTITGISDSDPLKWPNSHWRSVKVGWDESAAGGRQPRVSLWEIEPLTTFPIYPTSFPLRLKRYHSFSGMKADDMRLTSSPFWLCGDGLYQGMGFNPWLQQQQQPRLDSSLLGLQTDIYQTMANAAAVSTQEGCNVVQFQQPRAPESRTSGFIESQMLQNNSKPSAYFLESHAATEVIEPQLLHQSSFSVPMQIRHQYNEQPHMNYQVQLQAKQSLSNAKLIPVDSVSPLHSVLGSAIDDEASNSFLSFRCRPTKRIAVDPLLSGNMNSAAAQSSVSLLPPFPGVEQPESNDPQNHLLFGVNIDSSSPLGLPSNSESGSMAFPGSSYVSGFGADCSLNFNPKVSSSTCIDESDFILSSENNLEQAAPLDSTFVKVYKSGSFGRSLDITKFSSYHELRSQLARMFGLEGQLEDPLRSGWQLVFVDRENDVLLLGDDPWEEFVNSVWCIKILSPQEVQEMGTLGMELLSS
ncbi:auxin response factor 3, partial [Genlisea aurea]